MCSYGSHQYLETIFAAEHVKTQGYLKGSFLHPYGGHRIQMALYPLANQVGFLRELATETLIVLLTNHLLLQSGISLGHKLLYIAPLVVDIL